jgi:hypothetical protein
MRGGVCPEAVASEANEPTQINNVVAETLRDLMMSVKR